jgi:septum formation protein
MKTEYFHGYQVVLASKSPRRQQLMQGMDIPFIVFVKDVDESFPADLLLDEVASFLSRKKADAFLDSELPDNYLLITADTIVVIDGKVLNKPANRQEAIEMLTTLSGREHRVVTGVSLRDKNGITTFSDESDVRFVALREDEIVYYVDHYQPFDKAGSYGIQEWIGYVAIESVTGSFFNVMGLPTHRLYREIEKFSLKSSVL